MHTDSLQLVRKAISFERPDRVPLLFRTDPDRSDIVGVDFSPPTGWTPPAPDEDEWGCVWANIIGTGVGQVVTHPLENATDLKGYEFPDPHADGRFDRARDAVARHKGKYIAGKMGISGFNLMMSLRGFENLLVDVALGSEFLSELTAKAWTFEAGIIEEFAKCGVHGLWFFDDWGMEHSLFVHPRTWRDTFKPLYRDQFRMIHDLGMQVFLHSCGYVWDIIPDLIEIGVDVLNLEQPMIFAADGVSGIDRMASSFGGQVCFCTNPDSQCTLAHSSPAEVEEEVKHVISAFSGFGGGLIALADCGKDHKILPPANIEAMESAFVRLA